MNVIFNIAYSSIIELHMKLPQIKLNCYENSIPSGQLNSLSLYSIKNIHQMKNY